MLLDKLNWLQRSLGFYGEGIDLSAHRSESDAFHDTYKPIWQEHFFQPLRTESEFMLAGIALAASLHVRAKVAADRLLTRLKQSRLRRFDDSVVKLIGEVGEFLEIWLAGQPATQVQQVEAKELERQGADNRADTAKKLPKDPNVYELDRLIRANTELGKSQASIALELTDGDLKKAQTLLRAKRRWRANKK